MAYPIIVLILAVLISGYLKSPDAFGVVLGLGIVAPLALLLVGLLLQGIGKLFGRRKSD
jgi:tetrahydromethanopterin S-methyltransferase subunit B